MRVSPQRIMSREDLRGIVGSPRGVLGIWFTASGQRSTENSPTENGLLPFCSLRAPSAGKECGRSHTRGELFKPVTTRLVRGVASLAFVIGAWVGLQILVSSLAYAVPSAASQKVGTRLSVPLDVKLSTIHWIGKKVTGQHEGTVRIRSGQALLENGALVGGEFEIDLSTIRVSDIEDPSDNTKLTNHLKSEDFFAASLFPVATFTITKAEPMSGAVSGHPNYQVAGELAIKGIKRSVEFPVLVVVANGRASAKAQFELDRTQWNVRYGSGKFFENLGDKLIYDNFEVAFEVEGPLPRS